MRSREVTQHGGTISGHLGCRQSGGQLGCRQSGGQQGNAKQKSVTPSEAAATAAGICCMGSLEVGVTESSPARAARRIPATGRETDCLERVIAIAPGLLVHKVDELTGKGHLVDTGAI
jgi:hypothetical protein